MKCEICHKNDAQTAIHRGEDDEEELYVCHACAKQERLSRQKKSQRTRKVIQISGEIGDGEEPPPIVGAIISAFDEMAREMQKAINKDGEKSAADEPATAEPEWHEFPVDRVPQEFRIGSRLQLEGLYLIGELDAVKRAARALRMELVGVSADGVNETGHAYSLRYEGASAERAKRVVGDLLREERNARIRLFEELPRVFGDSLCRALAILKNCRLLSNGELFDLLSPLRLAARERMLDGITFAAIDKFLSGIDLTGSEDKLDQNERDRVDSERADRMNRRFEDVVLNERAEEKFL